MILMRLIFLVVVVLPLQINLDRTEWINENESDVIFQHNCLHAAASIEHEHDPNQILSYCLDSWPSKWNIQKNSLDKIFTFIELFKLNITSYQLYLWSAPMDLIERYQFYLNQILISNQSSMEINVYYNCTLPRFGPICQYSLDNHGSLDEILHDYYFENTYEPTTLTCYMHLQCDLGSKLLCLDWSNICDGEIQCSDGIDEEQCWQMEINQCKSNEYRCRNGQCIPAAFSHDNLYAPDCLDKSDEYISFTSFNDLNIMTEPTFRYEDVTCLHHDRYYQFAFPTSCVKQRNNLIIQSMFAEKPNSMSDICWSAVKCYLNLLKSWDTACRNICLESNCTILIEQNCPEMFYMPSVPVLFSHIYFAYTKNYIIKWGWSRNRPEYICYNEKLCDGFGSRGTRLSFNNATCREPWDINLYLYGESWSFYSWYSQFVLPLYRELYKCNTILRNDSVFCNRSTMYQCLNSSKCISKIRLLDNKIDCDYVDDEKMFGRVSRNLIGDGLCQSGYNRYSLCNDEPSDLDYIRKHISFSIICDGPVELTPIEYTSYYGTTFIGRYSATDETSCSGWPCNTPYTRCDGFWDCFDGADEVDCYPSSIINCPVRSHVCVSPKTNKLMCFSIDKVNDTNIDCLGGIDEPKLCRKRSDPYNDMNFYCNANSSTRCINSHELCDRKKSCSEGDDEQFCTIINNTKFDYDCRTDYAEIYSNVEQFFCDRFRKKTKLSPVHFTLDKVRSIPNQVKKPAHIKPSVNRCHRGLPLRVWLNSEKNSSMIRCLCPPSFYGNICQYQNERISLTIQFQVYSDSWKTPFTFIVSLIDDTNERIIHSYEQHFYQSMINDNEKFNIYLLYSTRPKDQTKHYSIHIDIYDKLSMSYRGSWLLPVLFSFLPVQRIAVHLKIPPGINNVENCSDDQCHHGQCIRYLNDPENSTFCQCYQGWSGRYCTIPHISTCSSDSLHIGVLVNKRSVCLCPRNKWGSRCLLHAEICQSNRTCHNDGQCVSMDQHVVFNKKFVCICPKGFIGDRCEIFENKIILSFEGNLILSLEKNFILPPWILIHFIEVKGNAPILDRLTYKRTPTHQMPVNIYWSHPFHIAFVELFVNHYYLIIVQKTYKQSNTIVKILNSSDRCLSIREVFSVGIANQSLFFRIKYYQEPCQNRRNLSCFYDEVQICLCYDYGHQRIANCFEFNHTFRPICYNQSNSEDDEQCLYIIPTNSQILMPFNTDTAFCYKPECQFDISLDAFLDYHIQSHIDMKYQPSIVHVTLGLTIIMTLIGLVNGIYSIIVFQRKKLHYVSCGFYLLGSFVSSLFTMILFALKFSIFLITRMRFNTNRSLIYSQCVSIDFLLRISLNINQWLNTCIIVEQTMNMRKGRKFNAKKSREMAKYIILTIFRLTIGTNLHDPIHRRLFDDDDNNQIWCFADYSCSLRSFNRAMNIFHLFTPFIINYLSIADILKHIIFWECYEVHMNFDIRQDPYIKHRLLVAFWLIILSLPRLIISLISNCMEPTSNPWLFLAEYSISFIPSMLSFIVFRGLLNMYR